MLAFNDIADDYISEAEEYERKSKNIKITFPRLLAAIFSILSIALVISTTFYNANNSDNVQSGQTIYHVGDTVTIWNGTCEYVACDNYSITLRIRSDDYRAQLLIISANKRTWVEADGGYFKTEKYVGITNGHSAYWDGEVVLNSLDIFVDGVKKEKMVIPNDGQVHEVIIDYSYFVENGYDVRDTFYYSNYGTFWIEE